MKTACIILGMLVIFSVSAGCVSEYQNPDIRITSIDISDITPIPVGSFDTYTVNFRVENPMNVTFDNVRAQIVLIPSTDLLPPADNKPEIPGILSEREKE